MLIRELTFAAIGTGFTCLATVLGAAMVFFFREDLKPATQKIFLGFAAGVMVAASVWSLLIPSMEMAEEMGQSPALPVGGGFLLGGAFLMVLDRLTPHLHIGSSDPEGLPAHLSRTTMIVLAVTLHNIPEGMAVGISFALAAHSGDPSLLPAATALAMGIGIQNFPEGAAISLPLHQEGMGRGKAFLIGAASGVVEPIFALLTVLAAGAIQPLLPWLLSFAAGAMLYVVVEELIPEANLTEGGHTGTLGVMAGFLIMMILDVALG